MTTEKSLLTNAMSASTIHKNIHTLSTDWVFNKDKTFGIVYREADGNVVPWHDHAFMEVYIIARGHAEQKTIHRKERLAPGDVCFFNLSEAHAITPEKDFSYFILAITPSMVRHLVDFIEPETFLHRSGIDRLLSRQSGGYGKIILPPKTTALALSICRTIQSELATQGTGAEGMAFLAWYTLCAHIARAVSAEKQQATRPVDERLSRLMEYIQAHPDGDLSAETLSGIAMLHKSYLSRLFTRTTRYTISEYITEVRMERACQLLKSSALPVYRIAERSGYNDLSSFHEKFLRHNASTPAEYRKKYHSRDH